MVRSLRMQAVMASFAGFPAWRRRRHFSIRQSARSGGRTRHTAVEVQHLAHQQEAQRVDIELVGATRLSICRGACAPSDRHRRKRGAA
jgi:hypothetical protein